MMHAIRCSLVTVILVISPFLISGWPVLGQVVPQATPAAAAPGPAQVAAAPAAGTEEKPVRDVVDAFAKAYNTPNIQALGALF
ncbi:MAG: hypothetical protein ACLQIB_12595, partial [Isosphaeraceae bacterium]